MNTDGAGKTTTLRLALGLEPPTAGRVLLGATDLTGVGRRATRPLRRAAALVHQNPFASLDPRFTVRESIVDPHPPAPAAAGTGVFVSHDLAAVAQVSHTVSVLRRGVVVEEGPVAEVFRAPAADYTRELLAAIPGRRTRV